MYRYRYTHVCVSLSGAPRRATRAALGVERAARPARHLSLLQGPRRPWRCAAGHGGASPHLRRRAGIEPCRGPLCYTARTTRGECYIRVVVCGVVLVVSYGVWCCLNSTPSTLRSRPWRRKRSLAPPRWDRASRQFSLLHRSRFPWWVSIHKKYTTSHPDFGAATYPGVGGGTHRRRATSERC